MKRFRFSLQALLTMRQRQEQLALETYAKALAAQQQAAGRLREAERRCEQAWTWSRQHRTSAAAAAHLAQIEEYCRSMDEFRGRCAEALRHAQGVVAAALERFLVARKSREAVDKFRARKHEQYELEARREEQKMIDDRAQRGALAAAGWLNTGEKWS